MNSFLSPLYDFCRAVKQRGEGKLSEAQRGEVKGWFNWEGQVETKRGIKKAAEEFSAAFLLSTGVRVGLYVQTDTLPFRGQHSSSHLRLRR